MRRTDRTSRPPIDDRPRILVSGQYVFDSELLAVQSGVDPKDPRFERRPNGAMILTLASTKLTEPKWRLRQEQLDHLIEGMIDSARALGIRLPPDGIALTLRISVNTDDQMSIAIPNSMLSSWGELGGILHLDG